MKETEIYKKCIPLFKKLKAYGFRVENACEVGTPDAFFQSSFFSLWTEFKQINTTNKIIQPAWRPGQLSWARRHFKFSGLWALIISVNNNLYFTLEPKLKYKLQDLTPLDDRSLMGAISKNSN
jgi:hypothetical protein